MQNGSPFDRLRARRLILWPAAAVAIIVGLLSLIAPHWTERRDWDVGLFYLVYAALAAGMLHYSRRLGLQLRWIVGAVPRRRADWVLTWLAVPLIAISAAGLWLIYLPISYLAPSLVTELVLTEKPSLFIPGAPARNAAMALCIVLLAPVVEELLFRGLLLHRWARKWGTWRGVLASSAAFALVHIDILGGFVFGVAMVIVYVHTRTLWVPIACHVLNNALAMAGGALLFLLDGEREYTLSDFRADWWMGLLGLAIGAPLLWAFARRYWPRGDWQLPLAVDREASLAS